jgi:hypothetical protein
MKFRLVSVAALLRCGLRGWMIYHFAHRQLPIASCPSPIVHRKNLLASTM